VYGSSSVIRYVKFANPPETTTTFEAANGVVERKLRTPSVVVRSNMLFVQRFQARVIGLQIGKKGASVESL